MTDAMKVGLTDVDEEALRTFVRNLYQIFLGREADPGGLEFYVAELRAGKALVDILAAMVNGREFQERRRREVVKELGATWAHAPQSDTGLPEESLQHATVRFPLDYEPPGESGRSYRERVRSGFFQRYCCGPVVLDVGFDGYDNPERKTALPGAIGIDVDYPGYDGITLPFPDGCVDTVFSSHCLEHILCDQAAIRDWYRVLRVGGFIVCIVPSQALYEKKRFLPSRFNADHKRMYTPANLMASFEACLETNSYRVRHLAENDRGFNYTIGPDFHSDGAYEIELVIEKINPPAWKLAV